MSLEKRINALHESLLAFADEMSEFLDNLALVSKDENAIVLLRDWQEKMWDMQDKIKLVTKYKVRRKKAPTQPQDDDEESEDYDSHVSLENGRSINFEDQKFK